VSAFFTGCKKGWVGGDAETLEGTTVSLGETPGY
jgi:hypothetical protein